MKNFPSIARVGMAVLLCLQVVAPYVHLANHAACHTTCQTSAQDHAELVAQHAVPHACAICQWLSGNSSATTEWKHAADAPVLFVPESIPFIARPAYPAFDFNVAVARGPPALSLDLV